MFLLNERITFKDFITNRYKIIDYTSKSFITNEAIAEFNEKYVPEAPNTILKKLAVIGKAFSEKLIKIIEDPTSRKKLFNIEEVTISILKELESEANVNFLPEMLEPTGTSNKYNYEVAIEVVNLLNNEFKLKNHLTANSSYSGYTFIQSAMNNDFDFITYNKNRTNKTQHKEFIINTSKLENHVNYYVEEFVELETILEALNLTNIIKDKPDYKPKPNLTTAEEKEYYSNYIKNSIK